MAIRDWSQTAASNTVLEGISVGEGLMNISDFNNSLRAMAAAIREVQAGGSVASAATVNIGAANADYLDVSGTTTITAFDSVAAGVARTLRFAGVLTLTHNGSSLILPTGTNIVTAAGDVARFRSLGSGNWRCENYMRASGAALITSGGTVTGVTAGTGLSGGTITTSGTIAIDINSLTEDATPSAANDFLATYDASAAGIKKVRLSNVPGTKVAGTQLTLDPYALNQTVTQAHGLGERPIDFDCYLECKSNDLGYTTGAIIPMPLNHVQGANPASIWTTRVDATNLVLTTNSTFLPGIVRADTRSQSGITAASWKLIIVPYAVA